MGYRKILYRSIPLYEDYHPSDLGILRASMQYNKSVGVTGYLWRANGQFVQTLHGKVDAINRVLERIVADKRHSQIEILLDDDAPQTSPFRGFSMGYDHFFPARLGIDFIEENHLPRVNRAQAEIVFDALVRLAGEALEKGGGFVYSRQAGESEADYERRLATARS